MALSNTTQNTLRTQPYYDDFYQVANTETGLLRGEDFDFHRILFRPRYGVQVRELTQLQTLLQAQLERLGTAQFRDGDRVIGTQLTIDTSAISGQVLPTTNLISFFDRTNNEGKYVYAKVAGQADFTTAARITQFVSVDDAETTNNYLVFKYTSTNTFGASGVIQDSANASITATFASGSNTAVFHGASTISVDEGVMFVSGFFVRVRPQTIVLDALDNAPSYRVGMEVSEEFLDELDDVVGESLLDEANRGAVGAHRFRVRLNLAKRSIDNSSDAGFIEIARVIDGQVIYTRSNPRYVTADELKQTLARRTYDESGDYVLRPFLPVIEGASGANSTNSADVTTFQLSLAPGKAYVRGYEIETNAPVRLTIDKGRTYESANNRSIPTSVGSYLLVTRVVGTTTPNSYFVGTSSVDVHCVPMANIDSTSTTTYNYSKIGTAKIRMLETYSVPSQLAISEYANAAVYKLFAYDWAFANNLTGNVASALIDANGDIELTIAKANGIPLVNNAIEGATIILDGASSPVSGTFSVKRYGHAGNNGKVYLKEYLAVLPNANTTYRLLFQPRDVDAFALRDGTSTYDGLPYANSYSFQADVATIGKIDGTPDGFSLINATSTNKLLYQIPERFVKSGSLDIGAAEFTTWLASASNTRTMSAQANASLSLAFAGNTFSIPVGSYTAADAQAYFNIFDITNDPYGHGQIVQFADAANANSTNRCITDVSVSAAGSPSGSEYDLSFTYRNGSSTSNTRTFMAVAKALVTGYPARTKNYFVGNTTHAHASTTAALENGQAEYHTLNVAVNFAYSLRTHDVMNLRKVLYKSSNTAFANSDMSTATDVTSYFALDSGQRDNTYEYGRAVVKAVASSAIDPTGRLLFVFDHFMHEGIGYATVDSYLSTNNINKGLTYDDIPVYVSPKSARAINLRSVLDFRPALGHYGAANGNIALVFASSNTDANTIYAASDGTPYLIPVSNDIWNGSYQYYLPRIDVVTLAANGEFHVTQGKAAVQPKRPNVESNDLLLYELTIPPYTLVDDLGVPAGVNLTTYDYKRYTMRDIAKVDDRVKRLEYYTALSQLEKSTLDQPELDQNDNERFKNGIVVDNFTGTGTADVAKTDFAASIDTRAHELHPAFRSFSVGFNTDYANTTTQRITVVGDMAVPTYEVEEFISQPLATKSVSVNPFDIGTFYGKVQLSPAVDTWKSTTTLPAQVIDTGGPTQAWVNANLPSYTVWGEWATTWTGYTTVDDHEDTGPNPTEWKDYQGQDTKIGDFGWRSWEDWEASGSPIDPSTGLPSSR
jgi:hypothetical protein